MAIKRDFDKRLLFLVCVLLVLLALLIAYHEITYSSLMSKYNKNQEIFGGLTADAILEEFNKTSSMKETAKNYRDYLEKRYSDLAAQNEKLLYKIESLKGELVIVKSQQEYQKVRDGGPVEQFRLIQEKNTEINRLKEEIREMCLKLSYLNITERKC